jgi:bifunctional DNase/RNase
MQKEQIKQIFEIECSPIDSIILAILYDIPMYCKKEALDKTIAVNSED